MSRTATDTRNGVTTAKAKPSFARLVARAILLLWWAFIAAAAVSAVQSLGKQAGPGALDLLPRLLDILRHQPPLVQVLGAVGVLVLVALMAWLTWIAWQAKVEAQQAQTTAAQEDRIADAQEGAGRALDEKVLPSLADIEHGVQEGNDRGTQTLVEVRETRAEVREIANRLTTQAEAKTTGVVAPTGLPRPATLVGRDDELKLLLDGLRQGKSLGVFALKGMGGIGKSALAAEAVAQLSEDLHAFPGGAAWVSCEALTGPEGLAEVWARVARALGMEQVAAIADAEQRRDELGRTLAARERTLLALDNVEKGLDADAVIRTLAISAHIALLLTAREAIDSAVLQSIELHPLPDPDAGTLFSQRLHQSERTRPTSADEADIPKLVEDVGGLPLAIEVTAAYAGVQGLPLSTILAELAADGLNAAAFHTTPKRAPMTRFDRSWDVLTLPQQHLFAGLSLLAGASFPRDAAFAIAIFSGEDDTERSDATARDDLDALVAYALVEPLPGERLRLHPLLREYAELRLSQFSQDVSDRLGNAMVAYWIDYAQAHPGYEGVMVLEAEAAGQMGALEWAHEYQRHPEVIVLAVALSRTWDARGRRDDEFRMYGWAEEAARALGNKAAERWASHQLAATLAQVGRQAEAGVRLQRVLELARQLGEVKSEADALHELAIHDVRQGRVVEARVGFERALALYRQIGSLKDEADELHELAVLDFDSGKREAARAGFERALELARQLGEPYVEQRELRGLADTIRYFGEVKRARELLVQALAISEHLGNANAIAFNHDFLGRLDRQEGRIQDAIAHFRTALRLFEHIQSPDADEVRKVLRQLGTEP